MVARVACLSPYAETEIRAMFKGEHDVEVVEPAELRLEPPHDRRWERGTVGVEPTPQFPEVAQPPDLDAEPVEPGHARLAARAAMRLADPRATRLLFLVEKGRQVLGRPGSGAQRERRGQLLEQVGVALRPEEDPEQLPAGPRVVPPAGAQTGHEQRVRRCRCRERSPLEQAEHHVSVPDPPDQSREPCKTATI